MMAPRFAALASFLSIVLWVPHAEAWQAWSSFQNGGSPIYEAANLHEAGDLPTEWSPDEGIRWQVPLAGYGQSTPVVFGQQVYLTSVTGSEKQNLHVQALSLSTGEEIWRHKALNSSPEENTNYVSRAAPSPACDDDGVIAFFEGGNVIALTHEGKVRWTIDLVRQYGDVKARHSLAASVEQDEDRMFVWVEREQDPYVLAVDKDNGKVLWRAAGLGTTSWASPRLVPVDGGQHLVLSGIGKLAGLDPESGERLWDFADIGGNSTPTPVPVSEGRFLIGASPGPDGSGGGNATKSNGMIRITSTDEGYQAGWLWQAERATSSFGSPMAYDGKAWFVNRQGVIFCLNAENGDEHFVRRSPGGSVWATPLASGDRIYLFGKDGVTTVVANATDMQEIATNDLWQDDAPAAGQPAGESPAGNFGGPVLYAATPFPGGLLLRRGDRLYCVGK
jgi:outer membrane protein assembly factor BamB